MQVDALLQELSPSSKVEAHAAEAVEKLRILLQAMPSQQRSCDVVQKFAASLDCQMEVKNIDPLDGCAKNECASSRFPDTEFCIFLAEACEGASTEDRKPGR